ERSLKATQLEERLELDRRIGQLLGYSTQDIEFYIQHISNRHLKTKI
ncbi:hemin receptor, partial [Pseudomonas aeruginosa]